MYWKVSHKNKRNLTFDFENHYLNANAEDQESFKKILSEQDPTIIEYFANPKGISDTSVYRVIRVILGSTDSFQIK